MKAKNQIKRVVIENGIVTAFTSNDTQIKLSRNERNALRDRKNPDYIKNIKSAFKNVDILSPDFTVEKDGVVIYIHK